MQFRVSQNMAIRVIIFIMGIALYLVQTDTPAPAGQPDIVHPVPMFDNLGRLHHPITTKDAGAQAYFDQGLRLIYAFNHEEAIRSFAEAIRHDPDAAMAYWGIAYALGPNINAPMDHEQERRAYEAVQTARAKAAHVTPRERAYIEALAVRYSIAPDADRPTLDRAYAENMGGLYREDPTDADAATMFAEALMNVRPWDYWTHDGHPQPGAMEIVRVLEETIQRHPDHIGACHYYIHAVEAWQPERALPCAERLPSLAPGAGHLVHMPSHIYIRVGRYEKAVERNVHAVSADQHYLEERHLSGIYPIAYYPHNIHFLWTALIMQGRSADALKSAHDLIHTVSIDTIRQAPELEFLLTTPLFTMVRFGQWDEVLRQAEPPADLAYTLAIWHYARGLALTTKGQMNEAQKARRKVIEISDAMSAGRMVGLNSAQVLLGIASHVLSGQITVKSGQIENAMNDFEEAVRLQDGLRYNEPPDWYYPVRESLGRLLLTAGRAGEAERVFQEDLRRTPENPWSLYGLAESLRVQKKERDAATVEERFRKAWSVADVDFQPARFEAFLIADRGPAESKKIHDR
jgi:tetratricopeptide (TPR) repeat protein